MVVVVVVVIHRTDFRHASVGQGLDLQNILRQSYDYLTIMQKLQSTLIMRRTMAGVCRFLESRTMYQVIGKVAVCAVVCVLVITVMDAITHREVNEDGCNFNCAVIVRYIARHPARQLPDACTLDLLIRLRLLSEMNCALDDN